VLTEDDLGKALNDGTMSVDDVIAAVSGEDEVYVYPAMDLVEGDETWQDVEELGAGSTLFADLRKAGATDDQMDEVGAHIVRLREAGRTIDKVFAPVTPEGDELPVVDDVAAVEPDD
jgi:hypothetical protein